MKNIYKLSLFILLLGYQLNTYPQEVVIGLHTPLDKYTIKQIRRALFETSPTRATYYYGLPVIRDSIAMSKVTTNPRDFVDSLVYVNPFSSPLEYPYLLLKRFPELIFNDIYCSMKIRQIIDSLDAIHPNISAKEYWTTLQKKHADLIEQNFKCYHRVYNDLKNKMFFPDLLTLHLKRRFLSGQGITFRKFHPNEKPYLDKLGIAVDPSHFITTK